MSARRAARQHLRLAAVGLAALLAASCANRVSDGQPMVVGAGPGGSPSATESGQGGGGGGETGVSDAGVTDSEIRIGFTGPIGGLGGTILGEEAAGALNAYFGWVNERGGVNGRRLKLVAYDNRTDFTQDATNARRLYEQDGVIGMAATLPDALADYVTRNEIPTMVLGLSAPAFSSEFPTVYPILQSNVSATYAFTWGLKEAGIVKPGMRVGMTYDTELIDIGPYISYAKEAWEIVGAKVVMADPFNFSEGDCTPMVNKMRSLDVDWWDFEGLSWVLCVSAAQRLGYQPNIGWGNWPTNIGALAREAGPRVDGVWFMAPADEPSGYPREKSQAHIDYVEQLRHYAPRLTDPIHLNSVVTQTFWMVGRLWEAALREAGDVVTKRELNTYFQSLKDFDMGIAPPLESWDPKCKAGVNTVWTGQWKWESGNPIRVGRTPYLGNPVAAERYGKCFVTTLADKVVRGE